MANLARQAAESNITADPMPAEEARSLVDAINGHINGARVKLLELYERRGWEALGHKSWRECVTVEFQQSQTHLYRQLQAAEIERNISPMGEIGTIPERVLRPLAAVPKEEQPAIWKRAVETSGGNPSVRHVEDAIQDIWIADSPTEMVDAAEDDLPLPFDEPEFHQTSVEVPEDRGLQFVVRILSGLGTLKDAGGMKALSRGWSQKDKRKTRNLIRSVVATLKEWCVDLKGGTP